MSNSDIPVREIGEMLDMMSNKLPELMKELYNILYSEESAITMSKAVATFYKNLMEAGMDNTDAMKLTEDYMSTLKSLTTQFGNS